MEKNYPNCSVLCGVPQLGAIMCVRSHLSSCYQPRVCGVHGSVLVVSLCASVCNALTFDSLDTDISFSVFIFNFRISTSSLYVKVMGSSSRVQGQKSLSVCPDRSWVICLRLERTPDTFGYWYSIITTTYVHSVGYG